ncbi:RING finger and SPRY domain-containing protein 1-like [Amphibalanus amphitrite]|uniref:RING finger and SPRY domain-containing protein 1-like n=1 Tax=Amphibalanus amphitrite TaxID=1232801 RepID=UPI001C916581|nr:RING finger and SPRY domain-containing protein 1-like [Amphibalanus amphitrite]
MGSCLCSCLTGGPTDEDGSRSRVEGNGAARDDRHYLDCGLFVRLPTLVDNLVLETLDNVRTLVDLDQDPPRSMVVLHMIADKEDGWLTVVLSMVNVIPMADPLGPAVILLLLDDCPLPTKDLVVRLAAKLKLSSQYVEENRKRPVLLRNVCVVFGCLAEKMAGPNSLALLTDDTLAFLLDILKLDDSPTVILFSLIALEKFAQTSENKLTIKQRLAVMEPNPLLRLEAWVSHADYQYQQVGFCAQWCLDNLFEVEGRPFTYEGQDFTGLNVMLNSNDTSEYLKISPDGLQARCDATSFESVRCTFPISSGCWYYEVTIVTSGVMQIGWATKNSRFLNYEGYGIGDDDNSLAYDGCRQLLWYNAQARGHGHRCWRPGDVLGALLDTEAAHCVFSLNGDPLPPITDLFSTVSSGFFAAASFMSFQQCRFNFGRDPFRFPPTDRPFKTFNEFGTLSEEERIVLPRQIRLHKLRQMSVKEGACTLCFDNPANIALQPCGHRGFCSTCAGQLEQCPMCRTEIAAVVPEQDQQL